jgi:type VI secretion system protein ImpJ
MERPLFWHQGLFLQPQHFQLTDLQFRSLVTPLYHYLTPYMWGSDAVEIQNSALENRSFHLLKGTFLFPDMTHVTLPANAVLEARSFEDAWVEGGKPFTVYVGLRKWNDTSENVTVLAKLGGSADVNTRFVTTVDPEEAPDLHQDGPPARVQHMHYVLKIYWESEVEQLGDYQLLPVAQLERRGDQIVLADTFIPPTLTIGSSETLLRLLTDIKDLIAARGHQLEAYKRERGVHTTEFGARDTVYLLALRSLNRYIPLLEHMLTTPRSHPWMVYGILKQMVGELSSFSEQINVKGESEDGTAGQDAYDHRQLYPCFAGVRSIVTRLLDDITAGPEYAIALLHDGTYFASDLPPSLFEGRNRYYLVFETEEDPQSITEALENISKLASRESLPILIARSLPGIRITAQSAPPQELPRRARGLYYQIDHHSDQWQQVQQGHNIALYWDTAPQDLKIELMVVGRD